MFLLLCRILLLHFFEKYSLEIQKQYKEKQKKKVEKIKKAPKRGVPTSTDVPSTSTRDEELFPPRKLEKQPSTKQLTIATINKGSSSDSDTSQMSGTNNSITISTQDSSDEYSYISVSFSNSEQADIITILIAKPPESADPHVSKYESETDQLDQPPEQPSVQTNSPQAKTIANGPFFTIDDI
jgi:hypothetical protein